MRHVETVDRAHFKRHQQVSMTEADMAEEPEDPDLAADRLEAALERIARLTAAPAAEADGQPPNRPVTELFNADLSVPEIAERLDALIVRLRAALGAGPPSE